MNKVCLTGRITKDVELRATQNGTAYTMFTIAVDRQFKDANGQKQTDFISCVAWNNQADFMSRYIKKGNMLELTGSIQTRTYQTQQNETRAITEVIIDSVSNLTPKPQEPQQNQGYQQQPQQRGGYQQQVYQTQGYQKPSQQEEMINIEEDLPF